MQSIPCAPARASTSLSPFSPFLPPESPNSLPRFDRNGTPCGQVRSPETAKPGLGAAPSATGPGAAAGLVSFQTSGTSPLKPEQRAAIVRSAEKRRTTPRKVQGVPEGAIPIDREKSRLTRLRCSVLTAARLHVQEKSKWKVAMLTLTYDMKRFKWEPGQISSVVRHIRQWLARKGHEMRFVWVMEFQKNGNPHYHLLLWLPFGLTVPKPDKRGWWPWGWTKIEWARNAVGYIAKYASKGDSLHQPEKGARMHGNGGLTGVALLEQRWWRLPGWLRERVEPSDCVKRRPTGTGGGFFHPDTGEVYESPWEVFFKGGLVYIVRKGERV